MNNWKKLAGAAAITATAAIVQSAEAQVTSSSVRGVVTNTDGAAVAGANVVVTHTPSGTKTTAATNENGVFTARGLRVGGPYTVNVSGTNFAPVEVNDIFVNLDETFSLVLNVEAVESDVTTLDTVVITAQQLEGLGLDTGLSTALSLADLQNVVTIDRDIADAAQLDPLVTVTPDGRNKQISIAGANNRFNSLTIDGVALNDRFGLNSNGYPTQRSPIPYDAIEQLQIETAPYDLEFNGFTGGTINAVTKSGTNEFHGSVFYEKSDDSMAGDTIRGQDVDQTFEEESYGFTIGGPIIKDKLFFFAAYDFFEEIALLDDGPVGAGAFDTPGNITLDEVAQVSQVASNVWGFDIGGFSKPPVEDEKILGKIDWNITDSQRASFTYIKTEGNLIAEQNGNNFLASGDILGASSAWYDRSETVEAFIGQLFSDWSDNLSTQFKVAHTTQATGQDSLNGADFPSMAVNLATVADDDRWLVFGPDRFRHGNSLDQEFFQVKGVANYLWGNHDIKAGFEYEKVDVDNFFAQNSEGSYAFEPVFDEAGNLVTSGLQNLAAANASGLLYNNAITNNEEDLRAVWGYDTTSIYLQDTWQFNNELTLQFGLRTDFYSQTDGEIRENANFIERNGFTNAKDFDDLDPVILPRASFVWAAQDNVEFRGGFGRFSGGAPNVWVSNSFSNDGVVSESENAFGNVAVPTTPDAATGQFIPGDVLTALSTKSPNGDVNALDPSFEIATTLKFNLGVAYTHDFPMSEGWTFSADMLFNDYENSPYWYRGCNVASSGPDGRPVYDCGRPEDIMVGSVDLGESFLLAFAADKSFDNGIDLFASYTHADVEDIGMGTSSTATSNYSDTPRFDLQVPTVGTSNFETEHLFKLRASWEKEFFGDYATKVAMFATRRSGQPYSYTFSENNACVFDVGGGRCARESRVDDAGHLLYVPAGPNDPLFSAASFGGDAVAQAEFFDYINSSELSQYAGGIAERNGDNSRWSTIVDLRFQQELPGALKGHNTLLYIDLENVGNLLNDDWGVIERTRYEYERDVVSAQISDDGTQFVYDNLQSDSSIKNIEVLEAQSLWKVKVGIKYEF